MIDVLVVDDDYMTASVHRAYTERVAGFRVVGEAHTGAQALRLVEELHPDLVLLDIYLPDISGLDVIRRLRAHQVPIDVMAVTAAKDVKTLRAAMQGGVVHYLVKPFLFDTFRDRLDRYAALRGRIDRIREASQQDVDHLFSLVQAQTRGGLPKGISAPTLALALDVVREAGTGITAIDVAERAGISRGTARRYLEYLEKTGAVALTLRYGTAGRPEHVYSWAGATSPL
jgi:two-component system CitB family response regulator